MTVIERNDGTKISLGIETKSKWSAILGWCQNVFSEKKENKR